MPEFFYLLIVKLEDRITLDHLNKMRQAFEVRFAVSLLGFVFVCLTFISPIKVLSD